MHFMTSTVSETLLQKHLGMIATYADTLPTLIQDEVIPKEELKEYIAFARTRIEPKLSDEATEELVTAYSRLRSAGRDKKVRSAGGEGWARR